jgi:hypothetical protein
MLQGEPPKLRKDDLPILVGMIELVEEGVEGFEDPPVPGYGLLEDFVLGVHRDLVRGRFFQVDAEGIRIKEVLGRVATPAHPVRVRGRGIGGHGKDSVL